MSDGDHFRGLAPGQHSSEETSQRWRAVGDTVFDLINPGIKLTSCVRLYVCYPISVQGRFF